MRSDTYVSPAGHKYEEIKRSRVGSSLGSGGARETQIIRVTVKVADEAAKFSDYDPRILIMTEYIPRGSPGWHSNELRSDDYTITELLPPITYDVTITFTKGEAPGSAEAETRRWMWSRQGTTITERMLEEPLDAVKNPPEAPSPRRLQPFPVLVRPGESAKMLATTKFEKVSGNYSYKADSYSVDADGNYLASTTIPLTKTPTFERFDYDGEIAAVQLTGTRIFPNCPEALDAILVDHFKKVNRWAWRGADPGHVLLADYRIEEISMVIGDGSDQPEAGIAHRFMLMFLWAEVAWTPLRLVPTIRHPTHGAESWVMVHTDRGFEKYVEEFRVKGARDFKALLTTIEQRGGRG